jgi:multiple sugar transport system permease protein
MMFPRPIARAPAPIRLLFAIGLPAALLVWILPLLAIGYTSTRPPDALITGDFWGWPSLGQTTSNYATMLTASPTGQFLLNSLLVTMVAVAGTLVVSSMAGFALAKYRFPGANALLFVFILGNLVPFQALMIPVRNIFVGVLPLYDTPWALVLFHISFQTGFSTFFMRNFISELPDEPLNAARLDGASEFGILFRIVLPSVLPALAALAVLEFTFIWNDYFWSLTLVQSDTVRPIMAGLQSLRGMYLTSWPLLAAASILAALPPVFLFFFLQRFFVKGLTYGASGY